MHFVCVGCGACCHGLRLTLTIEEAVRWIERGGTVDILCDSLPTDTAPDGSGDLRSERVFLGSSGSLQIGIDLILVASFPGACPNLPVDMRCGIYDERPAVCRVYPAEMTPGRIIDPASRRCPPEAWQALHPVLADADGTILDADTAASIALARRGLAGDAPMKEAIAAALGIHVAALRNEGFAVWTVPPAALLTVLRRAATSQADPPVAPAEWQISTNRAATRDLVAAAGAVPAPTTSYPNSATCRSSMTPDRFRA